MEYNFYTNVREYILQMQINFTSQVNIPKSSYHLKEL